MDEKEFRKSLLMVIFTILSIIGIILSNILMVIPGAVISTVSIGVFYIITMCFLGDR